MDSVIFFKKGVSIDTYRSVEEKGKSLLDPTFLVRLPSFFGFHSVDCLVNYRRLSFPYTGVDLLGRPTLGLGAGRSCFPIFCPVSRVPVPFVTATSSVSEPKLRVPMGETGVLDKIDNEAESLTLISFI